MTARFCIQCGKQMPDGYSFCPACGTAQSAAWREPQEAYPHPNLAGRPVNPQPGQAGPQLLGQPYQAGMPYQAGPQLNYGAPRVTAAKATGLIVGMFALVAAFILAVFVLILPSEEDFSLLGPDGPAQTSAPSQTKPDQTQPVPENNAAVEYGEPPASVLDNLNVNATVEGYSGSYKGTVSFKSENLQIMAELTGDSAYSDILSQYNGKTYTCTAEIDDWIIGFSSDLYSEEEDGSFYSFAYYDDYLQGGVAVDEVRDHEEEMGFDYYTADKAYFLTDGSVYVITVVTAELMDGRSLASEIRLELTPIR